MVRDSKFIFGKGYFVFCGRVNPNAIHHNAAHQILFSTKANVVVSDNDGNESRGKILFIEPLCKHKIHCADPVAIIYLSPIFDFSMDLQKAVNGAKVAVLQASQLPFNVDFSLDEIVTSLNAIAAAPITKLDPRLRAAIDDLSDNLESASILETAKRCNLSRSRLRTLARDQMGMPLSTWLMWRKIVKANECLSKGATVSEAALEGGFADQAHFCRVMKRMFGVTPTSALSIYTS